MSARPGTRITFNAAAQPNRAPAPAPGYAGLNVLVSPYLPPDGWMILSPAAFGELERASRRRGTGRWRRAAAKRARRARARERRQHRCGMWSPEMSCRCRLPAGHKGGHEGVRGPGALSSWA